MKAEKHVKINRYPDGSIITFCPKCKSENIDMHESITFKFGAYENTKASYYKCMCNDCGCEFQSEPQEIIKNINVDHWNAIDIVISILCIIIAVILVVGINVMKVY